MKGILSPQWQEAYKLKEERDEAAELLEKFLILIPNSGYVFNATDTLAFKEEVREFLARISKKED